MLSDFTFSHSLTALAEASLIALLVVGLMAGSAFAGKGGGKGGGWQAHVRRLRHDQRLRSTSTPTPWVTMHFVRFDYLRRKARPTEPWVKIRCYQGGHSGGLKGSEGYFERSLDDGVFVPLFANVAGRRG